MTTTHRLTWLVATLGGTLALASWGCTSEISTGERDTDTDAGVSSSSSGGTSDAATDTDASTGECSAISLGAFEIFETDEGVYPGSFVAPIVGGDPTIEGVQLDIFTDATGTFDLSQAPNDNYATCEQCLVVVRGDKTYFPSGGTLTISADSVPDFNKISATLSGVTLQEVDILEADPYTSTVVAGGECVSIASATAEVDVELEEVDSGT